MALVVEGLFALGALLAAFWLWSLWNSLVKDRAEAQRRQQEEQDARARAEREARLYRPGEKLRCLGCGAVFPGPLPDTGCPQCQLASFVVTERDYQRDQRNVQGVGRRPEGE